MSRLLLLAVFILGIIGGSMLNNDSINLEKPFSFGYVMGFDNVEVESPFDHIKEDKIHVYSDKIVLDIEDATWSSFVDTNSMDPIIDNGANGLEIKPSSSNDIRVGDIISFSSPLTEGLIVHRVVEKGADNDGVYFQTKGDNNPSSDPGKVRFNEINGVLVGVIY